MPFYYNETRTEETFTSSGTFNVPGRVNRVNILMLAGGGGGGAGNGGGGGGGGAGMAIVAQNLLVKPSSSITVTIGTGGVGASVSNTAGGDGGDSTFLGLAALGGFGGAPVVTAGNNNYPKTIIDFTDAQYRAFLLAKAICYRGTMGNNSSIVDDRPTELVIPDVNTAKSADLSELNWVQFFKYPAAAAYGSDLRGGNSLLAAGGATGGSAGSLGSGGGGKSSITAGNGGNGVLYIEYYK